MPAPAFILAKANEQLIIVVANISPFAPRLLPCIVPARALRAFDRETALEPNPVGQEKAEFRRRDQQLTLARQRPGRAGVIVRRHCQDDAAVGRGERLLLSCVLRERGSGGQKREGHQNRGRYRAEHRNHPSILSQSAPQGGSRAGLAPFSATSGVPAAASAAMSIVAPPRLKRQRIVSLSATRSNASSSPSAIQCALRPQRSAGCAARSATRRRVSASIEVGSASCRSTASAA